MSPIDLRRIRGSLLVSQLYAIKDAINKTLDEAFGYQHCCSDDCVCRSTPTLDGATRSELDAASRIVSRAIDAALLSRAHR